MMNTKRNSKKSKRIVKLLRIQISLKVLRESKKLMMMSPLLLNKSLSLKRRKRLNLKTQHRLNILLIQLLMMIFIKDYKEWKI